MKAWVKNLATTAFIIIYIVALQYIITINSRNNRGYRGVARRLGYVHIPPNFDPLVEKIERLAKANGSNVGRSSEVKNLGLEDEYFFNDGRLNMTLRLMVLFPALDREPKDGFIDTNELEAWIMQQTIVRLDSRTEKELEFHDKDGDGVISFSEYFPRFSMEDIERNEREYGKAGWWKEQFVNADADRNGTLDFYEFRDFLHPEDSRNERIQRRLLREKIRQMDYDKNKKLDISEFEDEAYNTYRSYMGYANGGEDIGSPEDVFAKLDVNKDRFLDVEELRPILKFLSPGEISYAKYYTIYLVNEADENKDGKLTIDEMLRHEYVFYNTLYDGIDGEDIRDEL